MLITVSAITPNPPIMYPGEQPYFRGYYSRRFIAGDGVTPVEPGNGQTGFFYNIPCEVNINGNLVVPSFQIQSTTDGNLPTSKFTGQLYDQGGAPREIIIGGAVSNAGWQIPTIYGDNVTWSDLARYNAAAVLLNPPPSYYTQEQVILEILALAGQFDYARVGHNGIAQPDIPPLVPSEPIFIGSNSPRVPLIDGTGTDTLVAGLPTTVTPTNPALVLADSAISLIPASDSITGTLHVTNRVVGVSFDVYSDNETDEGDFRYMIY